MIRLSPCMSRWTTLCLILVTIICSAVFFTWKLDSASESHGEGIQPGNLRNPDQAPAHENSHLQHRLNIPALIHQNYFFLPPAQSESGNGPVSNASTRSLSSAYPGLTRRSILPLPRSFFPSHVSSWQSTPFTYNFYSMSSARELLPSLASHLPSSSKYTVDDYIRTWESLPLGMLRADFWRYIVLYLYGGIYADLDVKLVAELPWKALYDDRDVPTSSPPAHTKKSSQTHHTNLIVGIEGDNTLTGLSRSLQIASWTMAATPAHPAFLCAMDHVVASSPVLLARHAQEADIERYIMDWTGPGVWTDCVLAWLNDHVNDGAVKVEGGVEDSLHQLRVPRKIYDTLVLPRRAFAVLQGEPDGVGDGVLVKHYFEGMWKKKLGDWIWEAVVRSWF